MVKIRDIIATKLKVQPEYELDIQTATDRKRRELEELMGMKREAYQRVGGEFVGRDKLFIHVPDIFNEVII